MTVRKNLLIACICSLSLFSCSKNKEGSIRDTVGKPTPVSEIYSGYPEQPMKCSDCDAAILSVSMRDDALRFADYEHFIKVRNCLAQQVEGAYCFASLNGTLSEDFDGEGPLDEFELWHPGFRSLRKLNNSLEAAYVFNGSDGSDMPFRYTISDPVEMTLISEDGKVWFGNELFDIENNPYEKSGCINVRATTKLIYPGVGNYYFRIRNSIFPWPWGTTVYGTTVSLRKKADGTFTQVVKKIGVQGGGIIYDEKYEESKTFIIFNSGLLSRKSVTRSYTDWGWSGGIKKNECATHHSYESLSPVGMSVY
jgi:hypothetical protein